MALLIEEQKTTSLPPLPKRFRHHALFSYAEEDAEYVKAVREALPKGVTVFDYKKDPIWGRVLEKELEHIYKNEAPFCVVFISQSYLASKWTKKELAVVSRVAKEKPGYMLPVVVDGTIVPEIEELAWLDKRLLAPEELAAQLVAKICEPPPKPWWFYVSTEAKVALVAVLVALILTIFFIRPSRTEVKSVQVTEEAITARLVNSRPKTATIVGQRLKFGALPIEDKELRLEKPESATIGWGGHDVNLIALELLTKCGPDEMRPNKYKVLPLLEQQQVTLEIDVRESDDAPGQSRRRSLTFPAANLNPFVRKWVSGRDTSCPD